MNRAEITSSSLMVPGAKQQTNSFIIRKKTDKRRTVLNSTKIRMRNKFNPSGLKKPAATEMNEE